MRVFSSTTRARDRRRRRRRRTCKKRLRAVTCGLVVVVVFFLLFLHQKQYCPPPRGEMWKYFHVSEPVGRVFFLLLKYSISRSVSFAVYSPVAAPGDFSRACRTVANGVDKSAESRDGVTVSEGRHSPPDPFSHQLRALSSDDNNKKKQLSI